MVSWERKNSSDIEANNKFEDVNLHDLPPESAKPPKTKKCSVCKGWRGPVIALGLCVVAAAVTTAVVLTNNNKSSTSPNTDTASNSAQVAEPRTGGTDPDAPVEPEEIVQDQKENIEDWSLDQCETVFSSQNLLDRDEYTEFIIKSATIDIIENYADDESMSSMKALLLGSTGNFDDGASTHMPGFPLLPGSVLKNFAKYACQYPPKQARNMGTFCDSDDPQGFDIPQGSAIRFRSIKDDTAKEDVVSDLCNDVSTNWNEILTVVANFYGDKGILNIDELEKIGFDTQDGAFDNPTGEGNSDEDSEEEVDGSSNGDDIEEETKQANIETEAKPDELDDSSGVIDDGSGVGDVVNETVATNTNDVTPEPTEVEILDSSDIREQEEAERVARISLFAETIDAGVLADCQSVFGSQRMIDRAEYTNYLLKMATKAIAQHDQGDNKVFDFSQLKKYFFNGNGAFNNDYITSMPNWSVLPVSVLQKFADYSCKYKRRDNSNVKKFCNSESRAAEDMPNQAGIRLAGIDDNEEKKQVVADICDEASSSWKQVVENVMTSYAQEGYVEEIEVDGEAAARAIQIYTAVAAVSGVDALKDSESPESKAAKWIIEDDPRNIQITDDDGGISLSKVIQRYIVAVIYFSLSGENWSEYNGDEGGYPWLNQKQECRWQGISCNENRKIDGISLASMNLNGTIPSAITHLKRLEILDLRNNEIIGELPDTIGNLRRLKQLILSRNLLSGPLPGSLFKLERLETLHLGSNTFSGTLSPSISNLTALVDLRMRGNNFKGQIPSEIGTLVELTRLNLQEMELSDVIPSQLGELTSLTDLRLNDNSLSGPVPVELSSLVQLNTLHLQNNSLTEIPEEVCGLSAEATNTSSLMQLKADCEICNCEYLCTGCA